MHPQRQLLPVRRRTHARHAHTPSRCAGPRARGGAGAGAGARAPGRGSRRRLLGTEGGSAAVDPVGYCGGGSARARGEQRSHGREAAVENLPPL